MGYSLAVSLWLSLKYTNTVEEDHMCGTPPQYLPPLCTTQWQELGFKVTLPGSHLSCSTGHLRTLAKTSISLSFFMHILEIIIVLPSLEYLLALIQ